MKNLILTFLGDILIVGGMIWLGIAYGWQLPVALTIVLMGLFINLAKRI